MVEKSSAAAIDVDTIVIGAGFYGCEIALQMKQLGHERRPGREQAGHPRTRLLRQPSQGT
jgi:glycine/D-amino acid oxidase-like deaminating enzyme